MSPITTHVLDLARGRPALGIAVTLERRADAGRWLAVAHSTTDADGRCRDLLPDGGPLEAGMYRLHFETGPYLRSQYGRAFYPLVEVTFEVDDPVGHYHV